MEIKADKALQGLDLFLPYLALRKKGLVARAEPQRCCQQVEVPTMPLLPPKQLRCTAIVAKAFFFGVFFFSFSVQRNCLLRKIKEPKTQANRSSPGKAAKHAWPRLRVCAALPCTQRAGRSRPPCRRFHSYPIACPRAISSFKQ